MEKITFKGTPVHTYGKLPKVGSQAPCFTLTRSDLTELYCHDLKGRRIVLNIFPSLDTSVCATSVRKFNKMAAISGQYDRRGRLQRSTFRPITLLHDRRH